MVGSFGSPMSDAESASGLPHLGDVLEDKYEIQEVLGTGAMGSVVRARHLLRKVPVALKFMSPKILGQRTVVERFLNEGVASSKIDSDHVVKVYDVSKLPSGVPYMVMEFLEGQDLSRLLHREARPYLADTARAVHFTLQMLRGLAAAHKVGIVHRDMKPANCFIIGKDGDPDFIKIVDFGISKIREDGEGDEGVALTHAGSALGTPLYMSLEQARSPKDVDARTDLYSVGVILYEMLCGVTPYVPKSGTLSELFTMLALEEPEPLDKKRPDLPPGLWEVVQKALHKNRDQRYQTAVEMAEALAPFGDDRSDYIASRMFRGTLKSRPPSAMHISRGASGTLLVDGPGTVGRTNLPRDTVRSTGGHQPSLHGNDTVRSTAQQTAASTVQNTAVSTVAKTGGQTVTEATTDRVQGRENNQSTPFVFALAIVAVGAVGAAAWALGRVSSTGSNDAKTVTIETRPTTAASTATSEPVPSESALSVAPTASTVPATSSASSGEAIGKTSTPTQPAAASSAPPKTPPGKLTAIQRD